MMTDREKLIALIMSSGQVSGFAGGLADHLIANGVVVREKGEWESHPHAYGFKRCSLCHDCNIWGEWADGKKWSFCPNCGADMRKGENG